MYHSHRGKYEKPIIAPFFKEKTAEASKEIGIIKKLNNLLPRNALLTIYKSLVRSHLNCEDILHHQPNGQSMNSKLESVQYSATRAITGVIKGTLGSKLCKELGLESLKSRTTFRRLCSFHKIICTGLPTYPFKHSFFPWAIVTWNKIHPET